MWENLERLYGKEEKKDGPLIGRESNRMSSRRLDETRSFCCVVNHHRMVVYRSWIFGFDSGIPCVTISGRFCDWTGPIEGEKSDPTGYPSPGF
ncbi:hypothetical protein GQ457_12G013170 [Hibiscus cannabinus]